MSEQDWAEAEAQSLAPIWDEDVSVSDIATALREAYQRGREEGMREAGDIALRLAQRPHCDGIGAFWLGKLKEALSEAVEGQGVEIKPATTAGTWDASKF